MNRDDLVYATYLNAFAVARSGGELKEWASKDDEDVLLLAARAIGANDGQDHEYLAAPRYALLIEVNNLLHAKKKEQPCKVVPIGDENGEAK